MSDFTLTEFSTKLEEIRALVAKWKQERFMNVSDEVHSELEKLTKLLDDYINVDMNVRFEIDEILCAALITDDGDGNRGTDKAIEDIDNIIVETKKDGVYTPHIDNDAAYDTAAAAADSFHIKLNLSPSS